MPQRSAPTKPTPADDTGHLPLVAAIGSTAAVSLFLKFGGSTVYVPEQPQTGSRLVLAIGAPAVAALRQKLGRGHLKVPLANAWIARQLDAQGVPRAEMCRMMRVSRTSLSGYLNGTGDGRARAGRSTVRRGRANVEAACV